MLSFPHIIALFSAAFSVAVAGYGSLTEMKKLGIISEKLFGEKSENIFTPSLVFTVLAESPAIYALLVALIILLNMMKDLTIFSAYALFSAAFVVSVSGFMAAKGIGLAASASLAAVNEKPKLFGKSLIFIVLPETIAIYGLLVALIILSNTGVLGPAKIVSMDLVWPCALASIIVSAMSITAYFLGQLGVAAVTSMLKNEKSFARSLIIAVLPESIAIYVLFIALMILKDAALL